MNWQWTKPPVLAALTAGALVVLVGVCLWNWRESFAWWTIVWWLFALVMIQRSRVELGAVAISPAILLQPTVGLPLVVLASATSMALARRPAWVTPPESTKNPNRLEMVIPRLLAALPVMLAMLVGGMAWARLAREGKWLLAITVATVLSWAVGRGAEILVGRSHVLHSGEWVRLLWWLAAWATGAVLVQAATVNRVWLAVGLVAIVAVHREATWSENLSPDTIRRTAEVPIWVEEVYGLVLEATGCSWFELRMVVNGAAERWSAGPKKELIPGPAQPPARPPVRFGIHRRPRWLAERKGFDSGASEAEVLLWLDPRQFRPGALDSRLMDEIERAVAAGRFRSAADRLPGGRLVDRQQVLELLNGAFASARDQGSSVAVALVGLDHAKEIQEIHGTEAGEQAVAKIGDVFTELLGNQDAVCRYGGEEFLLLLLGRDGGSAVVLSDQIRSGVQECQLQVDGEPIPLTASVGIAAYPEVYVAKASELIPMADSALYEARRGGKSGSLLATGRGQFRDLEGDIVEGSAESDEVAAPRLFV